CAELRDRVMTAASWPERFAILDEILLRQLVTKNTGAALAPEVLHAWGPLLRAGGAVRVADLATETGWSGRHLASRFRTETGQPPKAAARVIRFDRAKQTLIKHVSTPAHQAGGYRLA